MALERRRVLCGVIVAAILALVGLGVATAAIERPNALDRRVDALSDRALLTRPASALVDGPRQVAARRRAHWTLPGWLLVQVFQAVALFYLWNSGGAAALRDRLRRRFGSEWGVRFLFGAALALLARSAALLPSFYLYRVDRTMDLTTELTRTWGLFWIGHTLLAMAIAGIIAAVVLWLADRTHQWYLYAIVLILAASVGWSYMSPYFQIPRSAAARPISGALGAQLDAMLTKAGFPGVPVLLEAVPNSSSGRAVAVGLGASRRILLTESFVAAATPAEVRYAVAYELGHLASGDLLSIALIEGGVIIVFAAIAIAIADRIRFRRDDDPLSRLTIVGALLAVVYVAAVPVRNSALRSYDLDADRYAVALTRDPAAAVRALVRTTDQRMLQVCPGTLATLFLDTAPPVGVRIAAINHVPNACP
jgi:STE24 endopeptidase